MVRHTNKFKKRALASVISTMALSMAAGSNAQGIAEEEVIVTGIRGSLQSSLDFKRDSKGVVDAINAEDIGKFPDTNLAESLQRISGVSINRSNGEGQQVTVRGFGADFNLVTLNGRHMPTAFTDFSATAASTRAFDFSNIAAEGVTGVQVHKTGKASVATGGIGATINISTFKPLDKPGFQASIGGKLVHDTTNEEGSDVTPEISALISSTFGFDDSIGISFVGSRQERDSGSNGVNHNDWTAQAWNPDSFAGAEVINAPNEGDTWFLPRNLIWQIDDTERERTNAQLTFQFRPIERLTATLDYTYSELEIEQHRSEQSVWFAGNVDFIEFADGPIATPLIFSETHPNIADDPLTPEDERVAGQDLTFASIEQSLRNENKSFGINLAFEATDNLSFNLDFHDSSAESGPKDPVLGNASRFSVAAFAIENQTVNYGRDVATIDVTINDAGIIGGGDGEYSAADLASTRGFAQYNDNSTDVQQLQLSGKLEFDDGGIDFGIEARSMENNSRSAEIQPVFGDWNGTDPGILPDEFFTPFNYASRFGGNGFSEGFVYDFDELALWASQQFNAGTALFSDFVGEGGTFSTDREFDTNRTIEEDTFAVFFQANTTATLAGKDIDIVAGLRYERTDVDAASVITLPEVIRWEDNDDFLIVRGDNLESFERSGSYSALLPSIDVNFDIIEDLVARVSYGDTLARPTYDRLSADISNFSFNAGAGPTASAGNPDLDPIIASNLDLSLEWYYGDASVASVGYFRKDVDNFVGTSVIDQTQFGLTDPRLGDRGLAAAQDLGFADAQAAFNDNATAFFNQVLENDGLDPADQTTFIDGTAALGDPLVLWATSTPVNNRASTVSGFEFNVQHFFGESGFGAIANYTLVNGDVEFDVLADPLDETLEDQFVLSGLSDTFNLVGFYEKYGFQARISLNWRDEFFTGTEGNREPRFTEEFTQVDINVSYDINDNFNVFLEGININEEDSRQFGRTSSQLLQYNELGARYQLGARYKF